MGCMIRHVQFVQYIRQQSPNNNAPTSDARRRLSAATAEIELAPDASSSVTLTGTSSSALEISASGGVHYLGSGGPTSAAAVIPPRREPEAQAAEAGRASEDVEVLYGTGVPGGARARRLR